MNGEPCYFAAWWLLRGLCTCTRHFSFVTVSGSDTSFIFVSDNEQNLDSNQSINQRRHLVSQDSRKTCGGFIVPSTLTSSSDVKALNTK